MDLVNLTGYAVEQAIQMDGTGRETLLVAIKATFALDSGVPKLADEQVPVARADEYAAEPAVSGLLRAREMAMFKPSADVVLTGLAYSARSDRTETTVVLQVGGVTKAARVIGDRKWAGNVAPSISAPEPFLRMPLVFERAFGGLDSTSHPPEAWPQNPVGVGFRGKGSRLAIAGSPLPNLEHPGRPMTNPSDRPPSCAFAPIAPGWWPRRDYAGTYDERWRRDRMPFPPDDFSPRYEHACPADQVFPGYLVGGEQVRVTSVRPDGGGYAFALPALRPEIVVRIGEERATPTVRCDTLAIDTEAQRLWLVARASLDVHGRIAHLQWTKVQEESRA